MILKQIVNSILYPFRKLTLAELFVLALLGCGIGLLIHFVIKS